ncbi:unnamed protein product [Brugia timori]|uniref:Uncharacterized protein n=1 Tax=Brugia timori TaxID=42155 RepID=A0A0R3QS32_9BILA|nr:unnamed protein product [Brugia timori]
MNEIIKNKKKETIKQKCLGLKLSVSAPPELLEPVRMDATERESNSFDVFICSIFIRIETTGSGTLPFNSVSALLFTAQAAPVSLTPTIVVEANDSLALDNDSFSNS